MNEREMREALENCMRVCNALLDGLVSGRNVPTQQDIADIRYQVWSLSETVEAYRQQLDRYQQELGELTEAEAAMLSRIDALASELAERRTALAQRQRELEALEREHANFHLPKKDDPPAVSPEKHDDDAPGEDIPALISTLDQQNETALGIR